MADLVVVEPETSLEDRDTDLRLGHEVRAIDPAERTVTVATALHAGLSVRGLGDLDLGSAPPFGPVWGPSSPPRNPWGDADVGRRDVTGARRAAFVHPAPGE